MFSSVTCAAVILAGRVQFPVGVVFVPSVVAVVVFTVALAIQAAARKFQFGPRSAVAGMLSSAAGLALVAVTGSRRSIPLFFVASALLGLGYGLCLREGLLDVETFSLPEARGTVIGIYYVFTYLGFGLPPLLVWLNPQVGYALPFMVLCALALACAAVRATQIHSKYLRRA